MPSPPTKKRRAHYKSRLGCTQCKNRHVKCDEQQPICLQCSMLNHTCSYASSSSASLSFASPSDGELATPAPAPAPNLPPQAGASVAATTQCLPIPGHLSEQIYNTQHFALFHHATTDMMKPPYSHFIATQHDSDNLMQLIISSALRTPFLLDELLAFAALHKSLLTESAGERGQFRCQAMQLQSRALAYFNSSSVEITEHNCIAVFFFSSFIGMHMLHDTLGARADFVEVLANFMHFIRLYRGISVATAIGWHTIRNSAMDGIFRLVEAVDELTFPPHDGCARLMTLLAAAKDRLGLQSYEACREAVNSLQLVFNQFSTLPGPINRHIVLSWPVRIPTDFFRMLDDKQPEALAIAAYWATLLHLGRDFWIFGHSGRFLMEAIFTYLGPSWSDWMAWPEQQFAN